VLSNFQLFSALESCCYISRVSLCLVYRLCALYSVCLSISFSLYREYGLTRQFEISDPTDNVDVRPIAPAVDQMSLRPLSCILYNIDIHGRTGPPGNRKTGRFPGGPLPISQLKSAAYSQGNGHCPPRTLSPPDIIPPGIVPPGHCPPPPDFA